MFLNHYWYHFLFIIWCRLCSLSDTSVRVFLGVFTLICRNALLLHFKLFYAHFFVRRVDVERNTRKVDKEQLEEEKTLVRHWRKSVVTNLQAAGQGSIAFKCRLLVRIQTARDCRRQDASHKQRQVPQMSDGRRVAQQFLCEFVQQRPWCHCIKQLLVSFEFVGKMANECSFTLANLNKSSWNREQTKSATKSANRISEKSNIHLPTVFCYAFISGKDRFWILDWMRIFTHFLVLKLVSMEALWCQSFGHKQQNCGDEHSTEQEYDQTDDYQAHFSLGNYLTKKRHKIFRIRILTCSRPTLLSSFFGLFKLFHTNGLMLFLML